MKVAGQLIERGLRSARELAISNGCGTRISYLGGCRCAACRKANSLYSYEREVAVREGRGNPIVDATPARLHIRALSRKGVGYKAVASAAKVAASIVAGIRSGSRRRARRESVVRILAVTTDVRADHALIPAGPTWTLINQLLDEGYTKTFIAQQLGYARALQLNKQHVTVRNAARVRRLHRRLMS